MEHIKEAFLKVKQDMDSLNKEIGFLKDNIDEIREKMIFFCDTLKDLNQRISNNKKDDFSLVSTYSLPNSTSSTDFPTDNWSFRPRNAQISPISIGNKGVPTDRQTNQQTNQQTENTLKLAVNSLDEDYFNSSKKKEEIKENTLDNAIDLLNSLDTLKKELRIKFKRLTDQEFLVFSSIYQLEEEFGYTDYKSLSNKLNLTESSIRDYVGRIIKKGIPVDKTKVNNKNIQLSISSNIKKIATLPTILQLREI